MKDSWKTRSKATWRNYIVLVEKVKGETFEKLISERFHPITYKEGKCGGEGGIRTHVPRYSRDKSISSRPRYDHFGTSPESLMLNFPCGYEKNPSSGCGSPLS